MNYFVTGTGTDIGKTIVTALLTDFLSIQDREIFAYKPIQTGAIEVNGKLLAPDPEIYKLVKGSSHSDQHYTYLLQTASSPHLAAKREQVTYEMDRIHQAIQTIQENNDGLVVEGAGGLYVPITEEGYCMIDFIKDLAFPTIVVAEAGLGTINHTVLTVKALQADNVQVAGIIVNGTGQEDRLLEIDNMEMIEQLTTVPIVGTVPFTENILDKIPVVEHRNFLTKDWKRKIIESGGSIS